MTSESCPAAAAAAAARQRKKRKWDQPAESLPSGMALSGSIPVDTGSLIGNSVTSSLNPALAKIQDELIAREIVINDADASVRAKLTRRQMQEEIQKSTGAVVITRGKYRPPNALPDHERPLYLHISSGVDLKNTAERIKAVDRAASMVLEILKQGHSTPTLIPNPYPSINPGIQALQSLTKCVFLGFDPDPSVNIAARIRGPNDQYISHIMNKTGASVMIRGKGSGTVGVSTSEEMEQPMHLYISSCNHKSLEDARILAENLLDTIALEVGASRAVLSKVYKAVPPPQNLLDGVLSSDTACSSINVPTFSFPNPSMAAYASGSLPENGERAPGGTNYGSYEGVYPQATPLQQVASVLRGKPISVVPPSTSASSSPSLWKNSCCSAEADRRPQRRKFKELPVVSNGPATSHQNAGLPLDASPDELAVRSSSSSPPQLNRPDPSPANGILPPLPPKVNLPPVPKFEQPNPSSKPLSIGDVPDPLMKLMEYGDEDEDEETLSHA